MPSTESLKIDLKESMSQWDKGYSHGSKHTIECVIAVFKGMKEGGVKSITINNLITFGNVLESGMKEVLENEFNTVRKDQPV